MNISRKNMPVIVKIVGLMALVGTLLWAILELLLQQAGVNFSMGLQRVGFDLAVLSFSITINPGTLFGALGGIGLAFKL